jgi:predicted ATPase
MLVGPLMVPNKLIPRRDEDGEEYMVYFDESTVEQLAYKTMEDKIGDKVNIEHNQNQEVKDVYLAESWIIKDPEKDKSRVYGFNLPKGTWMGIYKVNNKKIWDEYVKTGLVKGFSVEGYFAQKLEKYGHYR